MIKTKRRPALFAAFSAAAAALAVLVPVQTASAQLPAPTKVDDPTTLSRHLYVLAPPLINPPTVVIDTTDFPSGKAWAEKARLVVSEWFPLVWRMMGTEGRTPPKTVHLVFKRTLEAPAYASGDTLTVSGEWITKQPDDFGMMVHELTHLIQSYSGPGERPGWLTEGIADYIRWWRYEPESPRTPINPAKASYRDSYRTTAGFLAFLTARYDRGLVPRLDRALRDGTYKNDLFTQATGKDLDALWAEFLVTGGPSYGLPAAPPKTIAPAPTVPPVR